MRGVATAVAVIAGVLAASGCASSHAKPTAISGGVQSATEVPSVLPRGGVNVNNQAVLKPLSTAPGAALSAPEAIKAARHLDNVHPLPARALEASTTLIGSSKVLDVPAWVVTFTSPKPVNVAQGGPGSRQLLVTHDSIVLDAVTGKMLFGFFTK